MKRGTSDHKETQSIVLARMAASRAELIAVNRISGTGTGAELRNGLTRTALRPSIDPGPVVLRTPNAALIALVLVGMVVIGPRQVLVISFRAGLTSWITRTIRTLTCR